MIQALSSVTREWCSNDLNVVAERLVIGKPLRLAVSSGGCPERCSKKLVWSYTADYSIAIEDNKATFILDTPNDNKGTNELRIGDKVSLDLTFPSAAISKAQVDGGGNQIKQNERTQINVEGTNLVGLWRLQKSAAPGKGSEIKPTQVRVRRTADLGDVGSFSDLKEAFLILQTGARTGEYDLKLASVRGVVKGPTFRIVR